MKELINFLTTLTRDEPSVVSRRYLGNVAKLLRLDKHSRYLELQVTSNFSKIILKRPCGIAIFLSLIIYLFILSGLSYSGRRDIMNESRGSAIKFESN